MGHQRLPGRQHWFCLPNNKQVPFHPIMLICSLSYILLFSQCLKGRSNKLGNQKGKGSYSLLAVVMMCVLGAVGGGDSAKKGCSAWKFAHFSLKTFCPQYWETTVAIVWESTIAPSRETNAAMVPEVSDIWMSAEIAHGSCTISHQIHERGLQHERENANPTNERPCIRENIIEQSNIHFYIYI